jgi:hypothetical protein
MEASSELGRSASTARVHAGYVERSRSPEGRAPLFLPQMQTKLAHLLFPVQDMVVGIHCFLQLRCPTGSHPAKGGERQSGDLEEVGFHSSVGHKNSPKVNQNYPPVFFLIRSGGKFLGHLLNGLEQFHWQAM